MIRHDRTHFDIVATLTCGQVFRFAKVSSEVYEVYSTSHRATLYYEGDEVVIESDDDRYFYKYFDLSTDYGEIVERLSTHPILTDALDYGKGIRILKQDKWETLVSFIISANNNIPRIKKTIERLCMDLGEDKGGYHAFPSIESIAGASVEYLESVGLGYRAKYLHLTANAIKNGVYSLEVVDTLDTLSANKYLCGLYGVGPKVADCILLFGYHRGDLFPVDTWIKSYYCANYREGATPAEIRRHLVSIYGDLAGYAQQYIFYYDRRNISLLP